MAGLRGRGNTYFSQHVLGCPPVQTRQNSPSGGPIANPAVLVCIPAVINGSTACWGSNGFDQAPTPDARRRLVRSTARTTMIRHSQRQLSGQPGTGRSKRPLEVPVLFCKGSISGVKNLLQH